MAQATYKKLNMSKLSNRRNHIISSESALKDIIPIDWSEEVRVGKKKIKIK